MRKINLLVVVSLLCFSFVPVKADMWGDVQQYLTTQANSYCSSLAKEVGPVIAGGVFHQGKSLGVPGFDVGIRMPIKNLANDFVFKSTDVTAIGLPIIQAELGLPSNIDLIVRMMPPQEGMTMTGFGVRYGIFKSALPGVPSISAIATMNKLTTEMFEATALSANVVASLGLVLITPYIGVGMDSTEVKATDAALLGTGLTSASGSASTTRIEVGANFNPLPLLYIYGGYTMIGADTGYNLGMGLKF